MHNPLRQILSLVLPITVVLIVPFWLVGSYPPFGLRGALPFPWLQFPLGTALLLLGLVLFGQTLRLFSRVGQGTLAPWDPPRHLVVQGVYRYVRNPMISGVLFLLLSEALLLWSGRLLTWAAVFWLINTVYFKLFEEPGLVKRFGAEYVNYRASVSMWIPRRTPWQPPRSGEA